MADKKTVNVNKWKIYRSTLKYRPKIIKLILNMRQGIRRRNAVIKTLKHRLKQQDKYNKTDTTAIAKQQENITIDPIIDKPKTFKDSSTQTLKNNASKTKKPKKNTDDISIGIDINTNNTESKGTVWKTGENEKSIADQVKEAALNALNDFESKSGWDMNDSSRENEKSIIEQVTEVAQSAVQQSGMVYVESAGMYYDYKTGYYYNSELGLYYHTDTNCYYYFSDEKQQFVFHSYPDNSAVNSKLIAHQKKKARKQLKRERKPDEDIDNLTKTLSQVSIRGPSALGKYSSQFIFNIKLRIILQDKEESKKPKRRKTKNSKKTGLSIEEDKDENGKNKKGLDNSEEGNPKDLQEVKPVVSIDVKVDSSDIFENNDVTNKEVKEIIEMNNEETKSVEVKKNQSEQVKVAVFLELEDGECSGSTDDDDDEDDNNSNASTATVSDEDAIAKHHPPCMRVIVRETDLPKLKVGSLFLITKDGGTVGREGEQHTILIKDHNVSRNHLDVRYDTQKRTYVATDLGSKNGTILNGKRMSESSEISGAMDILHGSTIQLGETKLLCHIHPGNDTCGHCEPGLLMETEEKEKKAAYTRTCSVKKQHELELARLKNIYAPKLLAIEEKPYNDRAQARRETFGSSHHSVKTESTDLDTSISTENKGFKLLQKMGWSEGEGLGKDCQGNTEPVPLISNDGKAGLGTTGAVSAPTLVFKPRPKNTIASATMRLASRTKMLQPPAKAFQGEDEEDLE